MRTRSCFSWLSVLVCVAASGCGGGDHASGSASTSTGSGAGSGGGASSGAGGAGGASGSANSGSASTGGMGGAAASSGSTTSGSGSSSGAGGSAGGLGAPCTWPQPCDPGLYCDAPGCGAGTCAQKPGIAMVPNTENLACGCDHVTYWNPENAAYHGAAVLSVGAPCPGGMALPCGPGMPCPSGFSCNRKVAAQAQCLMAGMGVCWSMPVSCPAAGTKAKACSNAMCATTCLLIQSENPWWDDGLCP